MLGVCGWADHDARGLGLQVLPFRVPVAHQLMYMPMWDPNAESLVTGPSQDDHDGGPAAGVASGFDPSGGEPAYQFGNQWVRSCVRVRVVFVQPPPGLLRCGARALPYQRGCCSTARLQMRESNSPASSVLSRERHDR